MTFGVYSLVNAHAPTPLTSGGSSAHRPRGICRLARRPNPSPPCLIDRLPLAPCAPKFRRFSIVIR
jgi:hypothetical protein